MDQVRAADVQYRIEHRHGDGSWAPLVPEAHDPAQRDPERGWLGRKRFRCLTCHERVVLAFGDDEPADVPR